MSDLLQRLWEILLEFLPLRIVRDWESGVRLAGGRVVEPTLTSENGLWGTGVHWFWPFYGEILTAASVDDVLETDTQTVGGITFTLGVRYRIRDLSLLYRTVRDQDDSLADAVRGAAADCVRAGVPLDGPEVLKAARKAVWGWGLELKDIRPITHTEAQTLRILTDA